MTLPEREQAILHHQRGELAPAEALYRSALARAPDDAVTLYNLGILLLAQARLDGLAFATAALRLGDTSDTVPSTDTALDCVAAAASVAQALLNHQYKAHAAEFVRRLDAAGLADARHAALWQRCRLPLHLSEFAPVADLATAEPLRRYAPIESERYVYAIDIVGGCNLRCPTCPVGQGAELAKGLMELALFERVLAKAAAEQAPHRPDIWLFNWGEPLLHPQVADFVRAVRSAGLTSLISTNLHHGERIDALMQANPDRLKVSLSSLDPSIYAQTHARGDIERVRRNLHALAAARDRHGATTQIWIGHHLYRNTLAEQADVQALAASLGFGYAPSQAIVAPIETALALALGEPGVPTPLEDQLLAHPRDMQAALRARRSGRFDCELRFNMTTLDHRGHVGLCCGTTQPLDAVPVGFLDRDHAGIERRKYANRFCRRCIGAQMHLTTADQ